MQLDDADWPLFGWVADVRPALADARRRQVNVVLATLIAATGSSPRPIGTQMLFEGRRATGYFSGGCLEADIANHAKLVLDRRDPVRVIYGQGSPWIDIRLICGGSLEILLEYIAFDDAVVGKLLTLSAERRRLSWQSNGRIRKVGSSTIQPLLVKNDSYIMNFDPIWRLIVVGRDPIALAIASLATMAGFETTFVQPLGPNLPPPIGDIKYVREPLDTALMQLHPDPWTAIISATHDDEIDDEVILAAIAGRAAYMGVVGSKQRVPARQRRLFDRGLSQEKIQLVRGPIGAVRSGKAPWEVAVSVIAEVMNVRDAARPK